jgi:hypothetical protein
MSVTHVLVCVWRTDIEMVPRARGLSGGSGFCFRAPVVLYQAHQSDIRSDISHQCQHDIILTADATSLLEMVGRS